MSGNDKKVIGKSAYRTYRKNLLGGTAIVAVVAVGIAFGVGQYSKAQAANLALDGNATTVITPTLADTIVDLAGSDVATIDVDVNAGDIVVGSNTVQSVNFDTNSGSIFLFDSNADAEATVNFDGDITIVAGKTLTFQLGDDEDSGTGLISVNLNIRDDNKFVVPLNF